MYLAIQSIYTPMIVCRSHKLQPTTVRFEAVENLLDMVT